MEDQPLQSIKGVGEKRAEQLRLLGVHSVNDLLGYLPRDYRDYSVATPVVQLAHGKAAAVHVRITGEPKYFRKGGMTVLSVSASDETGALTLRWFNQPYRRTQIHAGETVYACGFVSKKRGTSMINPSLSAELPGIIPIYPGTAGVSQRTIRDAVFAALKAHWTQIAETLPLELMSRHALCTRQLALRHAHFPASRKLLEIALNRLAFEDALCYLLMVEAERARRTRAVGVAFDTAGVREAFLSRIPFAPTNAQMRVMDAVDADMRITAPMNRHVQGDEGSGKTLVALYALSVAAQNGYQGALMAPTEILARQHFIEARRLFGDAAELLTGGMRKAARDAALARIASGEAKCVVGTHALIQSGVRFDRLGLVVTDEQHRFGVEQRARMQNKGARPDVLVMSATPIPRTLALLLFGDLDVSVIDEMPPGRKPVKTSVIPQSRRADMYRYIAAQAKEGVQTYVVCPMIEENDALDAPSVDTLFDELQKAMPDTRLSMLHGRMKEKEKQTVLQAFRDGETDVLVTTTVIEVGVHVARANIMVVEGADRFGLSQLHQLRGRVGRGERQAYCFLLSDAESETARERMRVMTETGDGFEIAQRDLELRGPGDFLGFRQHGEGMALLLGGGMDLALLETVKREAQHVIDVPNDENNALLNYACSRYTKTDGHIAMN